jgi:NAD(P)-dependent dehydrogenase (short-subunit alcohol dehydrogenase family)
MDPSSLVVLITGCSTGIGRAAAAHLVAVGHTVIATARRVDDLTVLAAAGCQTLPLDVTDEASMRGAVDAIEAWHGRIDVLVNNAGYSQSGAVESVPLAQTRAQFETNVFGPLRLTQLVLPGMRRRGAGRVVNVSSMGGRLVFPGGGVYHASKYALEALSDALRYELRPFGIAVVLIEPGLIRTSFAATVGARLSSLAAETPTASDAAAAYAAFNHTVARGTAAAYERGPLARMAGEPIDVARVIARAIAAPRPRARYTVALSATVFLALRRWLGDAGWDWFLRVNFAAPQPNANQAAKQAGTPG